MTTDKISQPFNHPKRRIGHEKKRDKNFIEIATCRKIATQKYSHKKTSQFCDRFT